MTTQQKSRYEELRTKGWQQLTGDERPEYQELKTMFELEEKGSNQPEVAAKTQQSNTSSIDNSQLDDLNKKLSLLMNAVDTDKLDDAQKEMFEEYFPKKETMPLIRLNFWEGKLIKTWKTSKDVVIASGLDIKEDQRITLTLEDGEEVDIPYEHLKFKEQKVFELEEHPSMDKNNEYIYRVIYNGELITLNHKFIN